MSTETLRPLAHHRRQWHPEHMLSPATSPATIGRARELEALRVAQAASLLGTPRGVMVAGEAGIGKTRLLADFVERLPDEVIVARGQCVAMGSITTPFAPLRGLLRDFIARIGAPALIEAAGPTGRLLPAVLPELADGPAGEISQEQLHDVVSALLEGVSASAPVVAIVEDVHWADVPTLDLLRSLLHTLRRGQVLVVLSYRTDDVGRGHPLRPFLTEIDRARGVGRVDLVRLTGEEATEQVRLIRGDLPEPAELAALVERSDGIPFFVEELLALETGPDDPLPETLRELVLARYARLAPATQAVLRLIAAGGVTVPHALIAAVHGGESDAFDEAVREAIGAQILVTGGADYAFRHALTHEAVHDELLPGERTRFHGGYARVLEQQADRTGRSAEIAHHWLAAHDQAHAFPALIAASREARAAGAPAVAAQLGERALELWAHVPDAEQQAGVPRLRLSQLVATAYDEAGDSRALGVLDEALVALEPRDRLGRALLLHELMVVKHDNGFSDGVQHGREALALLADETSDDDEALAIRARVMCGLSIVLLYYGLPGGRELIHETIDFCRSALERIVAPEHAAKVRFELVRALTNASSWQSYEGDVEGAMRGFAEALELGGDDPTARLRHDEQLTWQLQHLGRHAETIEVAARALAFSRPLGMERGWGSKIAVTGAWAMLAHGDLSGADAVLRRVREVRPMWSAEAQAAVAESELRMLRDDVAGAAKVLRDASSMLAELRIGDVDDDVTFAHSEARVALAERGGDAAWPHIEHAWAADARPGALFALLALGAQVLAELRQAGDEPPGSTSAEAEARLRAAMREISRWEIADDWQAVVDAELAGPDGTGTDPAAWHAAADVSARGRLPVRFRARSLRRLAEAQLGVGDRDSAAETIAEAAAFAEQHGLLRAARLIAEVAGRARLPGAGAASAPSAPIGGDTALTNRERQVLELVAQGLTNRQIGERLFISDKTASVHVSAILRKIGATGRAEAAARAAALLV